jgi:hypothetical protein
MSNRTDERAGLPSDVLPFLTIGPVARRLKISSAGVGFLVATGKLTAWRTPDGLRLFALDDVARLVAERNVRDDGE